MISLRRLLTLGLGGIIVLSTLVSGWFSYREGLAEANELFDAKLAHSARVLVGLAESPLSRPRPAVPTEPLLIEVWRSENGMYGAVGPDLGHAYETRLEFQVWSEDGELLLHSNAALTQPLAPLRPGFFRFTLDERRWRVFVLRSESGSWYVVAEDNAIRKRLAKGIAAGILLPLLIELPLVVALVWLVLGWGVRDLRRTIRQIDDRAAGRLDPVAVGRAPREVAVIIRAVNALLERLRSALERERRFTGDAAHELRTPISALRVHMDNLAAAEAEEERRHSLAAMRRGLDRLSRLVEQLLRLSRLEPGAAPSRSVRLNLAHCLESVLSEPTIAKMREALSLSADLSERPIWIDGEVIGVELLMRNLIDNALRYTPAGGRVRVSLTPEPDGAGLLSVEDSGPGIPASARLRVFERFHRELGSERDGSGLGLSIVRSVAEAMGARIELDDSEGLGGLRVRVWLPAAKA